jgi:acyl CoA:acetate/3-ketoacid CoA transferase alpha subunit
MLAFAARSVLAIVERLVELGAVTSAAGRLSPR